METVSEFWEMICPSCEEDDEITVQALIWVKLCGDGTEDEGGDHEWDDKSRASCGCGWEGTIKECKEAFDNA